MDDEPKTTPDVLVLPNVVPVGRKVVLALAVVLMIGLEVD